MIKKCIICENKFEPNHLAIKFCSDKCREQQRLLQLHKFRQQRLIRSFYTKREIKICSGCKKEKKINEFAKDKYNPDGHTYNCYVCRREKKNAYDQTEKAKQIRCNRENFRRETEPRFKLIKNIRSAIWRSFRNPKKLKSGLSRHLDYTIEELKIHLETQFDENMSWENQGAYWHIDHKLPVDSFDFTSEKDPEFKKCWALDNLRPLEKTENIRKSNKIQKEFTNE